MKAKKLFGLILALTMVLGLMIPVMAGDETPAPGPTNHTIHVHKILMDEGELSSFWTNDEITTLKGKDKYNEAGSNFDPEFKNLVDGLIEETGYTDGTAPLTKQKDRWESIIGKDGTIYEGAEITNIVGFFQGDAKHLQGVYFEMRYEEGDKKGKLIVVEKTGNTITHRALVDGETGIPSLPDGGYSDTELPDGTFLMAGKTGANGIIKFPSKGLKEHVKIYEVHEKSQPVDEEGKAYTLGDMKAVPIDLELPIANKNGVIEDLHVYPKNTDTKPEIDKNFYKKWINGEIEPDAKIVEDEEALAKAGLDYSKYQDAKGKVSAQIGTLIPYEVKTKIEAHSKYNFLKWTDSMTDGLTYQMGSIKNHDGTSIEEGIKLLAKIAVNPAFEPSNPDSDPYIFTTDSLTLTSEDYILKEDFSGFELKLTMSGLKKIRDLDRDVEFYFQYDAKVNNQAVVDAPDMNDIYLEYDNKPETDKNQTPPSDEGKVTVQKTWAAGDMPAGTVATFTLYVLDDLTGAWLKVERSDNPYQMTSKETSYTWDNLDKSKKYKVEETVNGYEPQYIEANDGTIKIYNHKPGDKPFEGKMTFSKTFTKMANAKPGDYFFFDLYKQVTIDGKTGFQRVATFSIKYEADKLEYTHEFKDLEDGVYMIKERLTGYSALLEESTTTDLGAPQINMKNTPTDRPEPINPSEPEVVTGGKRFVKTDDASIPEKDDAYDETNAKRLAGAEFIVYRYKKDSTTKEYLRFLGTDEESDLAKAYKAAQDAYMKAVNDRNKLNEWTTKEDAEVAADKDKIETILNQYDAVKSMPHATADNMKAIVEEFDKFDDGIIRLLEKARDEALQAYKMPYEWLPEANKKDATKLISGQHGRFSVSGLAHGTYYLEEVTAPEGYAKSPTDTEFEVYQDSYTVNKKNEQGITYEPNDVIAEGTLAIRIQNRLITIPPTGGIGTILFTVAGLLLMTVAIIAISKKRRDELLEDHN